MRERASATGSRRGRLAAYLAALVALADIPVHVYWAAGGTWALPGGAATAQLPGLRETNLAVVVLLACGAAWLVGLTTNWARRLPAALVLAPVWAGAVICLSHSMFGLATKSLYLAGVRSATSWPEHGLTPAQKTSAALHDISIFEPWFLLQGLMLAWAGHQFAATTAGRRRWAWSLIAGTVLVEAFGLILTATHHRLAIS